MTTGCELDALVAEKVMGFKNHGKGEWEDEYGSKYIENCIPCFSTNISDAWEVVEKMDLLKSDSSMLYKMKDGRWAIGSLLDQPAEMWNKIIGETAPHAICLAALKAVGYEVKR